MDMTTGVDLLQALGDAIDERVTADPIYRTSRSAFKRAEERAEREALRGLARTDSVSASLTLGVETFLREIRRSGPLSFVHDADARGVGSWSTGR